MKRQWLAGLAGVSGMLTAALVILSGCGGGGGPITGPETGPGPSVSAQFLALLPAAQKDANYVGSNSCLTAGCHADNYHKDWQNTTHAQKNVGCEQCHGPGSIHVTNRTANTVVADVLTFPKVSEPIVCGQCHGPTFEQFNSSGHAHAVGEVIERAHTSAANGITCMRCHSGTLRNEYIDHAWTKGLKEGKSVTQIQDEVHASILGISDAKMAELAENSHQTVACANCHDPHGRTNILTSKGNEAHLRRATFGTDTAPIAPGVSNKIHTNFNHLCGSCHNARGGRNDDGALTSSTTRPSFHDNPAYNMLLGITGVLPPGTVIQNSSHATAPDQCVTCHMPDKRHTFTVSLDRSCIPCHTATDASTRAATVRNEVLSSLLVLRTRLEVWALSKFPGKPTFWDYSSLVSEDSAVQAESAAIQKDIPIEIKRARHNYYFVVRDRSQGIHNTPYTRQLLAYSHSQLDALGVSRSVRVTRSIQQFQQLLQKEQFKARLSEKYASPDQL